LFSCACLCRLRQDEHDRRAGVDAAGALGGWYPLHTVHPALKLHMLRQSHQLTWRETLAVAANAHTYAHCIRAAHSQRHTHTHTHTKAECALALLILLGSATCTANLTCFIRMGFALASKCHRETNT
jgi:hypothetical protein